MPALAFDLGETLSTYDGIPLSWQEHYVPALLQALAPLGSVPYASTLEAACAVLARYNTRLTPREHEVPSRQIFGEVVQSLGLDDELAEPLSRGFFQYFQRSCRAYPETVEVLTELRRRGQAVAVLTDVPYGMPKAWVQADLKSAGIDGLVDILVTSVDSGFRKPRPEAFRHLARAMGVAPDQLIFVGNEQKDVEGVNKVGGQSILIDREGKNPAYGQGRSIYSLRELLNPSVPHSPGSR